MRKWLLWLSAVLLAGCAAGGPPPTGEAIARWEGKEISLVRASWGEPTVIIDRAEGQTWIYEATHYSRRYYPANLAQPGPLPYGGTEGVACRGVFEVDDAKRIVRAAWVGYECHYLP